MASLQKIVELTEYQTTTLPPANFSEEAAKLLHQHYRPQVTVNPPSFKNDYRWELTAQGWVGHLPLTPEVTLLLQPKVPLGNLLRMLEYAYDLKSVQWLSGLVDCHALTEFYERLAHILAQNVLKRARRGLYRAYLPRREALPYMRGRLNTRQVLQRPGRVALACDYEEQTADVVENQILAWTLFRIARSGMQMKRALPAIRQAYRALQGAVTLTPQPATACVGQLYNRLNEDYRPLHALCRFFLEQSGPGHQTGERQMIPFLVNMDRLFEQFVAAWLKNYLRERKKPFRLETQEKIDIDAEGHLSFRVDLVIYDLTTNSPRWVLDTKYKRAEAPSTKDIAQVTAYAYFKGCAEAVLIYPTLLGRPLTTRRNDIRVRSLTFSLVGDLEQAGQDFWQNLLER